MNEDDECMFVFMRRGTDQAAGILTTKPLFIEEKEYSCNKSAMIPNGMFRYGHGKNNIDLAQAMEPQCRDIRGPRMGIWCYR